jgi:hypothetical protein
MLGMNHEKTISWTNYYESRIVFLSSSNGHLAEYSWVWTRASHVISLLWVFVSSQHALRLPQFLGYSYRHFSYAHHKNIDGVQPVAFIGLNG